jgi:hypothetical protein
MRLIDHLPPRVIDENPDGWSPGKYIKRCLQLFMKFKMRENEGVHYYSATICKIDPHHISAFVTSLSRKPSILEYVMGLIRHHNQIIRPRYRNT